MPYLFQDSEGATGWAVLPTNSHAARKPGLRCLGCCGRNMAQLGGLRTCNVPNLRYQTHFSGEEVAGGWSIFPSFQGGKKI